MKNKTSIMIIIMAIAMLSSCRNPEYRMIYSQGFSFRQYDFMVFSKPEGQATNTSLYSMDVEISNTFARYNLNIVGNNEMSTFDQDKKKQTLFVRMAMVASSKNENLITLSFDDFVTGKTVASITTRAKGNMFHPVARTKAIEEISKPIIQALERDKGIKIIEGMNK